MKKLLSLSLVVIMVLAMFSVSASAAATTDYGTLVFEEEFTDASKATTLLDSALGGNKPDGVKEVKEGTGEASYFKIEDGKLKVNTWNVTTKAAMRFGLYEIPAGATEFTASMDVKTIKANAGTTGNSVALVIADNNVQNWDVAAGAAVEGTPGRYQFVWCRDGAQGGLTKYGDGLSGVKAAPWTAGSYVAGVNYNLTITVNLATNEGTYTLTNKDDASVEPIVKDFAYALSVADTGMKAQVGLMFNGVEAEVENVKVYAKGVTTGGATGGTTTGGTTTGGTTTNTPQTGVETAIPALLVVMAVSAVAVVACSKKRAIK